MSLKIALLTNYPFVDNVEWKRAFVAACLDKGYDVEAHYGKRDFKSMFFSFLKKRKYNSKLVKKVNSKSVKNVPFFNSLGVTVFQHKNVNFSPAIEKIKSKKYDIIVTALDQILSKNFLNEIDSRVVNVHYGVLPEIKGLSAIEWTYFKYKKCEATLHYINKGIDTGSIIQKKGIEIVKLFSFENLRKEIQSKIPEMLFNFISKIENGDEIKEIDNKGGKLYTFMHPDLLSILIKSNKQ